jgi:hypothetical protein
MPNKRRITQGLKEVGAAWATTARKYICTDHTCCNHLKGDKAAYHIHPDVRYPYQNSIRKFRSLKEVWAYIKARKAATKAADDYAGQFDCPLDSGEAEKVNEEANMRAARVMEDFWADLV